MILKNIFMRFTLYIFTIFILFSLLMSKSIFAGWQYQKTYWPRLIYKSSDMPVIKQNVEAAKRGGWLCTACGRDYS